MNSLDLNQLTPDSTLEALVSYNFLVDVQTLGQTVIEKFQNRPEIPGVIVTDGGRMLGMISQRKFLERMSQPYSLELYLKRPIQILLNVLKIEPLQLSTSCKIEEAARIALERVGDLVYDPIVLIQQDRVPRLLDIHDLLLAQNQVLVAVNNWFHQQRQQAKQYLEKLKQDEKRIKTYARMLEFKQVESRKRQQTLEAQQAELDRQSQQISGLNQQFLRISELLSLEGRKAFQATYDGVTSISRTAEKIVLTGNLLIKELEAVDRANNLIESVSKQVRHLALQASVAAGRSGKQSPEVSYIANEIRRLGGETFEASHQVNQIADQFKIRLPELTDAAQSGAVTAHALIQKIQQAQIALNELEKLVMEQKVHSLPNVEAVVNRNSI